MSAESYLSILYITDLSSEDSIKRTIVWIITWLDWTWLKQKINVLNFQFKLWMLGMNFYFQIFNSHTLYTLFFYATIAFLFVILIIS